MLSLCVHAGIAGGLLAARGWGWLNSGGAGAVVQPRLALGVSSERPLLVALSAEPTPPATVQPAAPREEPPRSALPQPNAEPEPRAKPPVPESPKPPPPARAVAEGGRKPDTIIDITKLGKDTDRPPTDAFLESLRSGEQTGPKFTNDQAALTRNAGGRGVAETPSPSAGSSKTGLPGEPGLPGPKVETPPPAVPSAPEQPQTPQPPPAAESPSAMPSAPSAPAQPTAPTAPDRQPQPPTVASMPTDPAGAVPGSGPDARPPGATTSPKPVAPEEVREVSPSTPSDAPQPPAPSAQARPITGLFALPKLNDLPRRPTQPAAAAGKPSPKPKSTGQGGANGQNAGGARRQGEQGDQSDRESPLAAVVGKSEIRAGRVEVGQGLEVRTSRINLDTLERFQVAGQAAVVDIYFRKDGTVRDVDFVQSSGGLDEPILNAVFRWRAAGRDLARLPDPAVEPNAALRVRMRITID